MVDERSMGELEGLKNKVEQTYGFRIKRWDMVKFIKKSSFVSRIVTKDGKKRALKSLFIPPERQMFIVKSEQILNQNQVKLARPIPTTNGDLYMIHKQVPYVLYEWIDGKSNGLRNQNDLESLVQIIARFHQASRTTTYPPGIKLYSHRSWEKEYRDRLKLLKSWSSSNKQSEKKKKKIIKRHIPFFNKVAKKALQALRKSSYSDYMDGKVTSKSLVHGDFHHKNLIFKKNKGFLIDFEDIRYDLPSKDLLRILSMYTKKQPFSRKSFRSMMKAYEQIHPLHPKVKKLIQIDLLFPHIFERMLRKKTYNRMSSRQLKFWIKQEKKKAEYLSRRFKKIK